MIIQQSILFSSLYILDNRRDERPVLASTRRIVLYWVRNSLPTFRRVVNAQVVVQNIEHRATLVAAEDSCVVGD